MPLVTIAMPVRNCRATLAASVQSIIDQTFKDWKLLLIDDGSTDGTADEARGFTDARIQLLVDGNSLGLVARLNQAIAITQSEYFARMDGDDIAYPRRLERQVAYLRCHPRVDLVGCGMLVFNSSGRPIGKRPAPESHSDVCVWPRYGFPLGHPTYLGRLQWFRRYGYREEAVRCEDYDLLFRSYRTSQFANLPEILLGYREGYIDLKKAISSHWHHAKLLLDEFGRKGRLDLAMTGGALEVIKIIADVMAVASGLNYKLLRHRARPLNHIEIAQWERVWQGVTARTHAQTALNS